MLLELYILQQKNRCSNVEQEGLVPTTPIVQHAFNEVQLCIKSKSFGGQAS